MTFTNRGVPVALGERRVLHPGMLQWLRALGWMVLLFFVVAVPAYASGGLLSYFSHGNDWGELLGSMVSALVCLGLYALLVWGGEARLPSEIAPGKAIGGILSGLVIGVLMFSAVMAIMAVFSLYDIVWKGTASPIQSLSSSISSGVVEEVLSRAVILRLVWRAFGPWVAIAVSAAIFGALHLMNPGASPFAALCIAVEAGVMLAGFYILTGRLWVSIGVHAAWNFTQGYLFGAKVSGTDFGPAIAASLPRPGLPDILTGGAFGPEASFPALFVGTAVGLALLWMSWKAGRFQKASPLSEA